MSNPRNALSSLLRRFGVAGPARVRAFQGSGAPKITTRRLIPPVFAATLGVLACTTAPALAAAPEKPEVAVERSTAVVATPSTEAVLHGVLNPGLVGEPGTYELGEYQFPYNAGATCVGGSVMPASPGMSLGAGHEELPTETLTGLTADTKYTVCLQFKTAGGTALSTPVAFTTATPLETPEAKPANPVAANTVTLNGVLNPGQARESEPGSYEFRYRQSATECQGEGEKAATAAIPPLGHKQEAASATAGGLLPHTSYTFCLLASNEAGEVSATSAPSTFTTLAAAPTIEAESEYVSEVTADSATLHATVNPQGSETGYAFEYASAGGAFKPVPEVEGKGTLPEGTRRVALNVHVQQLGASASYEFRVVVGNSAQQAVEGKAVAFTTQAAVTGFTQPDGREYELVTPAEKEGALFYTPRPFNERGGPRIMQASAVGNAIAVQASQPIEAEPQGYAQSIVAVLSTRGPAGWSSQTISPPHDGVSVDDEYQTELPLFSEDLSHALVQHLGPFTPLSPEAGESTPYVRTNYFNGNVDEHCEGPSLSMSSCFEPLVTHPGDDTAKPFEPFGECLNEGEKTPGYYCGPELADASPDLGHVIMSSEVQLTSTEFHTRNGLYEWSGGRLQLVSVFPAGEEGTGAVAMAGTSVTEFHSGDGAYARRAVSEDGERILFSAAPGGLYLRDVSRKETVKIGQGEYMTATGDMSRVFFLNGGNLDMFELTSGEGEPLAGKVIDLTEEVQSPGESADVRAVLGTSNDGSYVYFAAGGALTSNATADPAECEGGEGIVKKEGCNIYVRHASVTNLVAAGWINNEYNEWSRVSPDGRWLAFMSSRGLTGYDNRDANSGARDAEVYLYDATTGGLACASCDPTSARPVGEHDFGAVLGGLWVAANVPGMPGSSFGTILGRAHYQPRYLSDDGRLFFETGDALVPQDVDGVEDVYEYEPEGVPSGADACSPASVGGSEVFKPAHSFTVEGVSGEEGAGCLALMSSGTSSEPSSLLDASETGGDVFILTASQLTSANPGGANVYDAHECTEGSPCISPPEPPPACTTEASCKPSPEPQPVTYGLPSSATFSGPGNRAPAPPVVKAVTKKTVKCKKGRVRNRRGQCVKKAKKRARKAERTSNDRRTK